MRRREKRVLRIQDLVVDRPVLTDLVFRDQVIQGPAIIAPWECIFDGCAWASDFASTFWPISAGRPVVVGAIELERCTFLNCVFVGVGIAAAESESSRYEELWQ